MKKDEFKKFFKYISSVTTDTNPSPEKIQVYWDLLNDLPFDVAMTAAKKVLATLDNPFLPMPAVFRSMALDVTGQTPAAAPDAWAEVTKAIRNFGSYKQKEALASMSSLTRKAVEAIGWKELCLCEEPDVIRGQFRMAYEVLAKREAMDAKTPENLKRIIGDGNKLIPARDEEEDRKVIEKYRKEMLQMFREDMEDEDSEDKG